MIIYSDKIYMEDGIKDGFLEFKNGTFKKFYDKNEDVKCDKDYTGYRIIPGIFDTHNHGCYGYRMMDNATEEDLLGYVKGLAASGVSNVFVTTSSIDSMKVIASKKDENLDGAKICGIHSEGPFGSRVGEKGVNTGYPAVDMKVIDKMIEVSDGLLKLVDIAPEVDGAIECIKYLVSKGIKVGAYHTNANYKEANLGIDAGITVATHLGNVMTGLHHRDIGTLGACLLRPEVDCEIICDDLHISLEMIRIYFKVKDQSRFIMISDNVQYAGLPEGHYKGMTDDDRSDRKTILINEQGFVLSETGRLSGSSKPVIYGIKNLVEILEIPLEDVIKMSSLNPANKYGFTSKGSIKIDKDADFVVIDDNYDVIETYSEGRCVYNNKVDTDLYNMAYLKEYKLD